jgi:hypothetical protein
LAEQFVQQQQQQQEEATGSNKGSSQPASSRSFLGIAIILDRAVSCDPTLAEEFVCHPSFRIPTSPGAHHHHGDTTTNSSRSEQSDDREEGTNGHDEEKDDDDVSQWDELVYRILAFQKQLPTHKKQQYCFFTDEERYQRLPISWSFGASRPPGAAAAGGDDENDISVLLRPKQ